MDDGQNRILTVHSGELTNSMIRHNNDPDENLEKEDNFKMWLDQAQ